MNSEQEEKLKLLAKEPALDLKTGEDLSALSAKLVKLTVEAALSAEMENHLGGKCRTRFSGIIRGILATGVRRRF